MKSAFGVNHNGIPRGPDSKSTKTGVVVQHPKGTRAKREQLRKQGHYIRLSSGDSWEPKHKQTTFKTSKGKLQNVDRKMKRTVVALNRKGYKTVASDSGKLRFLNDKNDAYVSWSDKGFKKGKELKQKLPKRFKFDEFKKNPHFPQQPRTVVRFRSGPVI